MRKDKTRIRTTRRDSIEEEEVADVVAKPRRRLSSFRGPRRQTPHSLAIRGSRLRQICSIQSITGQKVWQYARGSAVVILLRGMFLKHCRSESRL